MPSLADVVDLLHAWYPPRTATGKLQKFKLREPYWAGRDKKVN